MTTLKQALKRRRPAAVKTFEFGDGGCEYAVTVTGRRDIACAQRIWDAADDGGIIQADQARKLFHPPEWHTTMNLARAFRLAGFELKVL